MTFHIRDAASEDEPALARIEAESFSSPHWAGADILKYRCVVAEIEGAVIGFLVARDTFQGRPDEDRPGEDEPSKLTNASEREILNLAVWPAYRRAGVASALLRHELRKRGSYYLEVRESNRAAQQLYLKLGFTVVGKRRNYYQNPKETAIVMRLNR